MRKILAPGVIIASLTAPGLIHHHVHAESLKVAYVNIEQNSTLNVRKTPSTSAAIVVTLKKGAEVTVLSVENGWTKISANGKTGYVSSAYLTAKQQSATTTTTTKFVSVDAESSLNVRSQAFTTAKVVTTVKNNTKVEVYSESNGWSKVKVNGKTGYVAAKYLKNTVNENTTKSTAQVSKTPAETKVAKYVNVSSGSNLNMRIKPNANSSVIVKLARGVQVTVYSEANGWSKIKVYGKEGYVNSSYLSASKIATTSSSHNVEASVAKSKTMYVAVAEKSALNMRNSASTKGSVIKTLSRGMKVEVLSEANGWSKVNVSSKTGYVSSSYLTAANPIASVEKDTDSNTVMYVNVTKGSELNLRKSASTTGSVITKLARGTKVEVYSQNNGWSKIKANGKTGFVNSKYITKTKISADNSNDSSSESSSESSVTKYVNVSEGSSLNMRQSPTASGAVVKKLGRNTKVTVLSESNGWSKIKSGTQTGYASSGYLSASAVGSVVENDADKVPKYVNVKTGSTLNMRKLPSASAEIIAKLAAGTKVEVSSESNGWSKISANGKTGYVSSDYLTTEKETDTGTDNSEVTTVYQNYSFTVNKMTDIQMSVNPQTDKQYSTYIREDALKLNSSDATKATVVGGSWRLRGGAGTNYWAVTNVNGGTVLTILEKVKGTDGYNWYKVKNTQTWGNASKEDTSYYINPQNFVSDKVTSLQFIKLSETANIKDQEVNEKILIGKGILAGKASSFVTAAKSYGVNEVYLISHALLETGNGKSSLANGVTYNGRVVYNMYGIGAYDGSAVASGAKYAYNAGWFTPEAAIIGGAKFIAQGYINAGQDTLYKMRWNPEAAVNKGVATHQYASDIGWATKQVNQIYNLYSLLDSYTMKKEIPVYKQ
ncbi:SH3 domain-containing protein [Niallia nealsonii]|uniref:Mannosyl-glycoprotein endo-beta-N-acetylglucosamidase n=1 Tax=Niallia nealsonii TaxID=115979 RepID=A0A2N0Z103_9BACI|nr:SH3 domain-containing protein [Niallia nealsonii]PKG23200.1 mannosyl-glycoprotein endo-beta-N-acetylglucosamidase [Niallia nealsonii]